MKKTILLAFVLTLVVTMTAFCSDAAVIGERDETWSEYELAKLLPAPDFSVTKTDGDEEFFAAEFSGATIEKVREYAGRAKSRGFTTEPRTIETPAFGQVEGTFYYAAKNDDGYLFEISYSGGGKANLSVKKP